MAGRFGSELFEAVLEELKFEFDLKDPEEGELIIMTPVLMAGASSSFTSTSTEGSELTEGRVGPLSG